MKKYNAEIIGAILCLMIGILAGYTTKSSDFGWYATLHKPTFNPPNWIFGPVWTILYLLMGLALAKLWRFRNIYALPLRLFILQLVFNALWSPLFFKLHRIDLALYDIAALWLTLMILLVTIWKNKLVLILLLPYGLWVSFALLLNASLFYLNK